MAEYIREVEKIIDNYHKQSPVFSLNRKTALFNALTVFEDTCRLGGTTDLALTGDGLEYFFSNQRAIRFAKCSNSMDIPRLFT